MADVIITNNYQRYINELPDGLHKYRALGVDDTIEYFRRYGEFEDFLLLTDVRGKKRFIEFGVEPDQIYLFSDISNLVEELGSQKN